MKALAYQTLINSEAIQAFLKGPGVDDEVRLYGATALGRQGDADTPEVPPSPEKPFGIITELFSPPVDVRMHESNATNVGIRVSIYDHPGDYERINAILRVVRAELKDLAGAVSPLGPRCLESRWTGFSEDLQDPDYDANMRFASFILTAND